MHSLSLMLLLTSTALLARIVSAQDCSAKCVCQRQLEITSRMFEDIMNEMGSFKKAITHDLESLKEQIKPVTCPTTPPVPSTTPEMHKCTIDMQSWGYDDNDNPQLGFIRLNGNTVVNTDRTLNYQSQEVHTKIRGITVVVLDPVQCIAKNIRHFDTCVSLPAATDLRNFLTGQPAKTILLAVTADDASVSAAPAHDAVRALTGSTISDVEIRGKYLFIAEVGSPSKSIFAKRGRYGSTLRVKATVQYTADTGYTVKALIV